jgi:hypothetical protein
MASATTTMIDIKLVEGLYIVRVDKAILVMTKLEFIQALRRGRWWKRRQQFQARIATAQKEAP